MESGPGRTGQMSFPYGANLTASQRIAVESEAPDLCVTAGAGSGKTRVLVERFIHLVLHREVPVDRILAITFTEKAAQEMKERIAAEFEKSGREKERREVEFAYVSTIDSFCARLLRENALEARVDPRFRVLEELEAERILRTVADRLLLSQPEERLADLLEATGITDLVDTLERLYEQIRHAGLPVSSATLEPPPRPETALRAIRERLSALERGMAGLKASQRAEIEDRLTLASRLEALPAEAPAAEIVSAVRRLGKEIRLDRVRKPAVNDPLRAIRDSLLDEFLGERLERFAGPLRRRLGRLLGDLHEAYEEAKRDRAALDFDDLEWKARRLLAESTEARSRVCRRFRHLFLDEYQDTNPLQREIVDLLRGESSLFVAGDAKQSIYGFRDADVRILAEHRERAEKSGGHVPLAENFRSRPEIVSLVNRLFGSSLWIPGPVPFESMTAAAPFHEKRRRSVELIRIEVDDGGNSETARQREARAIAARIALLAGEEGERITRKEDGEARRPLRYGDFAILFRSTAPMRLYERELTQAQIPYLVWEGRGYFQTQEVRDLVNLIRVLDNPRDDYALAALLRSPIGGLDDDDLFRLSPSGPESGKRLVQRLEEGRAHLTPPAAERLGRAIRLLEDLRRRKGEGPLWTVLEKVLAGTDLAPHALLHFNGRRRYANLRKLVDLVRSFEAQGETSLPELARLLEEYRGEEARESEARVERVQDDAVKLMTIHAAKGLEFPVVLVADLGRDRQTPPIRRSPEIFRRGGGLGFPLYDPEEKRRSLQPMSYRNLKRGREEAEEQEEIRLLYVAATRAREHLILSGWRTSRSRNRNTWLKGIVEALGGEDSLSGVPELEIIDAGAASAAAHGGGMISLAQVARHELLSGAPVAASWVTPEAAADAAAVLSRVALPAPPVETTPYLAAVSEIVQHHLCPRRSYLRYQIGAPAGLGSGVSLDEENPFPALKDDEVPAEVLGDRVHRILAEEEDAVRIPELLSGMTEKDRVEALRQVETFRKSELGRAARDGKAFREIPFALSRSEATLRGQIDLVIRKKDGSLAIVDYKTSRIAKGEVAEKAADYELQLQIYALAVADLFDRAPERACLYFLHPDVVHDVDLSKAALEAAERAIAGYFASHRSQDYPQRPARHCYPCGYREHYCPGVVPRID